MLIILPVCFIIDRIAKSLAVLHLKNKSSIIIINNFLNLSYVENKGAAFGLLSTLDHKLRMPILSLIAFIALFFIIYLYMHLKTDERLMKISFSFILGGAAGNIWDRVMQGYVVDFIDVHYYRYFTWPAFNFADIVITAGAGLIIFGALTAQKEENS
ncbi:MAG TPA: signal peptidase II [bacterium]